MVLEKFKFPENPPPVKRTQKTKERKMFTKDSEQDFILCKRSKQIGYTPCTPSIDLLKVNSRCNKHNYNIG